MSEQLDEEALFTARLQAQSSFFGNVYRIQHGEDYEIAVEEFDAALERVMSLFPRVNPDALRRLKEQSPEAKVVTAIDIIPRGAFAIAEYLDILDQLGFGPTEKAMLDFGRERYSWELREQQFR